MQHTIRLIALAAVATLTASGAAQAPASTLKGGVIYYQTHARTNGVTGIGIPPGADATVGNATTVLLT